MGHCSDKDMLWSFVLDNLQQYKSQGNNAQPIRKLDDTFLGLRAWWLLLIRATRLTQNWFIFHTVDQPKMRAKW